MRFFFCRFLSDYAAGLYLVFVVVLRPLHLDFNISKIQIGGKKDGIQQRTGEQEMAYLERSREKYCRSMELMKIPLKKCV